MSRSALRAGACAVACLAAGASALPATANAKAHGPQRLTINVQPNPSDAGDPLVIAGRLFGPHHAGRRVSLYARLVGGRFRRVQSTRANPAGRYLFARIPGVVNTNRDWFVISGPNESRTVHQRVHALVSLAAPAGPDLVNRRTTFTGLVTPGRRGERVELQRQVGAGGTTWRTIPGTHRRTGRQGAFSIPVRLGPADTYTIRARFLGDRRNYGGTSDSVDVVVLPAQNPRLTLVPSADTIAVGQAVMLTGRLRASTPRAHTVRLFAHQIGAPDQQVAQATTAPDGTFTFTQVPAHTTIYQVRSDTGQRSRVVVEAVQDVVTATANRTSATVGDTVTFSGTVAPAHPGHAIVLQHRGIDGLWHTVETSMVRPAGTYQLGHVLHSPGTQVFRVKIDGGPANDGAASAPMTLAVSPPAT